MSESELHSAGLDSAVVEGGAYEVIRKRLLEQANGFESGVKSLNERRQAAFGKTSLEILSRIRLRTANNCIPRDIALVGDHLLLGFNVFIGLKKETQVADVFASYRLTEADGEIAVQVEEAPSFLTDSGFVSDFQELYAYYKSTTLLRMQVVSQQLLVTFRIGQGLGDVRVFRWSIGVDGEVTYVDDRGERNLPQPRTHEFTWQACGREDQVAGRFPHISILDRVFVDTTAGSLNIKVENNTEEGRGIYQEPVTESNQALDDAEIEYAQVGDLILLKIRPYREPNFRYLVFNPLHNEVRRLDAIGIACRELPEDHGIIFPGGCYLHTGELKQFDEEVDHLQFSKKHISPNGEDVLFVFHASQEGRYGLMAYNLISKTLQNPIYAHGYSLHNNGRLVVFQSESEEPTRNHPMQIWQTTFYDDDHVVVSLDAPSELAKVGNNELVRFISECFSVVRQTRSEQVSLTGYNDLVTQCQRLQDNYFWLGGEDFSILRSGVESLAATAELVVDEYEKVAAIQDHANTTLTEAERTQEVLRREVQTQDYQSVEAFVASLGELRQQRGHLLTIRELRYIQVDRVDALEQELVESYDRLAERCVGFLLEPNALAPYSEKNFEISERIPKANSSAELAPELEGLEAIGGSLDTLTEVLSSLPVQDATERTKILESISEIYATLNSTRAQAKLRGKELGSKESVAEFGAQFTLLSQSIAAALNKVEDPASCDEQLSRLSVQLEELESRFGEHDEFLVDISDKRNELFETFETRRQALVDAQQRRAQNLFSSGERILEGVKRRTAKLASPDELNAFYSSDPMVYKLRELVSDLIALGDSVKADDLESRLQGSKDGAFRSQRDREDLFEDDGNVIKLGSHRFNVNTQPLDLTIVHSGDALHAHLTGTGYREVIDNPELNALEPFWQQALISETDEVYRAEYLASQILRAAAAQEDGLSLDVLHSALLSERGLLPLVHAFATPRYSEGYEPGVHDADCARILTALIPIVEQAGLLRFHPDTRALALLFWYCYRNTDQQRQWVTQAQSATALASTFEYNSALHSLAKTVGPAIAEFNRLQELGHSEQRCGHAAEYLIHELASPQFAPVCAKQALLLSQDFLKELGHKGQTNDFRQAIARLDHNALTQFEMYQDWLDGYLASQEDAQTPAELSKFVDEAAVLLTTQDRWQVDVRQVDLGVSVDGLLGSHLKIKKRQLALSVDDFDDRLARHADTVVPGFRQYQTLRQAYVEQARDELSLEDFTARPLASFVRNRLIDEVYLPIVGDNLAKQMGTAGAGKRTDLMGLLLLISPPGYGKTTLMEYVASRLGLVFLKINGPALGHDVKSLDPAQAPNATAANELNKLNLGLEMGNNVMLYVDDIQHTHPEFLQKFISLCDGTRRVEGVWREQTKTYDLRGRKFCVVMAGNPYTESGEVFRVPDMLANRADIYNLGDVLSGREEVFSLSFIENSLTSNSVLAPLATRSMQDVYRFVRMARGEPVPGTDFEHSYSSAESGEITSVLQKLFKVQEVLLKVNLEYIRSAAMDDTYRTEPAFLLQGSYRNMNKMAEKVVAVMNDAELVALIDDHYTGEAQLLTTSAEHNLLKLAQLRGSSTPEQDQRWAEILHDFDRQKTTGGNDVDAATKIALQLANLQEALTQTKVEIINQPSAVVEQALVNMAQLIETTFLPVVASMDKKIDLDLAILERVGALSTGIDEFQEVIGRLESEQGRRKLEPE